MQYFGSNIVGGVAESWVEVDGAGWRWMHGLVIPPVNKRYSTFVKKLNLMDKKLNFRGGSMTAVTSKVKRLVIIVNGFQPLTIITKRSILDVAAAFHPSLNLMNKMYCYRKLLI